MNMDDNDKTVIGRVDFRRPQPKLFCPSCGKQLLPDAKFCKYCGTPIADIDQRDKQPVPDGGHSERRKSSASKRNNRFGPVQQKLDGVWPGWKVDRILGEGAFGKVYHIVRTDGLGYQFESALKIISIPASQQEVRAVISAGMDEAGATAYFRSMVEDMVAEIIVMSQLKGITNIVSYEDHAILKDEKQIRWDIFIRMEYLTPLFDYTGSKSFTVRDVLKLGIDMCNALELCEKSHIIHRDIKPENIFVSDVGNYKLGDFGIARQLEKSSSVYSKKGTPSYMAPEVYKGEEYNSTVDIYSLGMVLYRLLNNNRAPFMPPYPEKIRYSDSEEAIILRMKGEAMSKPCRAEDDLGDVILKACAFLPDLRYQNASKFRQALMNIQNRPDFDELYPPVNILPEKEEKSGPSSDRAVAAGQGGDVQSFADMADEPEEKAEEQNNNRNEVNYNEARFSGQAGIHNQEEVRRNYRSEEPVRRAASSGGAQSRKKTQSPYLVAMAMAGVTILILFAIILFLLLRKGDTEDELTQTTQTETTLEATTQTEGDGSEDKENDSAEQTTAQTPEDTVSDDSSLQESGGGAYTTAMQYENETEVSPVEYDGHAYAIFNFDDLGLATYEECEQYCEDKGGHLAIIESEDENDFLYFDYLRKNNLKTAMFGFSNPENTDSPDDWVWVDGISRNYTNWSKKGNQPNHLDGIEQYAEFYKDTEDGKWNDARFHTNTWRMICEWE